MSPSQARARLSEALRGALALNAASEAESNGPERILKGKAVAS